MAAPIAGEFLKVSRQSKERLDGMQAAERARLGRMVTLAEVVENLIAEHDRNAREEAGA